MSPTTLPVSHHTAEKEYFLPSAVLETVASVLTPPHRESAWYRRLYHGYERFAPGRNETAQFIKLYDPESLRATAVRFYGTDAELPSAVQQRRKTMTNTAEPWVSSNTWTTRARQYQGSRDRILVVIRSPVFDKSTHKWRSAVMCDACWREFTINAVNREWRARHKTPTVCYAKAGLALYDKEAMEKHLAEYGPIHGPKNDRLHATPVVGRLIS
ncbi:hypothetical protein BDZ85DRAFT_278774 [Elsinoe ampelina]|uniref:Uncharacterized protein n=1 Tax=Elsinoe ampelina TaxID=302913 RepID=A0A6A6GMA4_9PEZI|nr:hypothetical protein BDZ85DRAFT_278774 [Elsinoe ampelina]